MTSRARSTGRGLVFSSDTDPGISRLRSGRGFRYVGPTGRPIRDPAVLDRIRALAIPPAWTDVWICRDPRGHLQAVGRDARGRKQPRYHATLAGATRRREVRPARRIRASAACHPTPCRPRSRAGRTSRASGSWRRSSGSWRSRTCGSGTRSTPGRTARSGSRHCATVTWPWAHRSSGSASAARAGRTHDRRRPRPTPGQGRGTLPGPARPGAVPVPR